MANTNPHTSMNKKGVETFSTPTADAKRARAGMNKTMEAERIFSTMINFSRALVIRRFVNDLGLSEAGASTYYQNCRKKAGLVHARKSRS